MHLHPMVAQIGILFKNTPTKISLKLVQMKMIYDAKCVKVHLKQIYMLKIYISCKISVSIVHGNHTQQLKNEFLLLYAKEIFFWDDKNMTQSVTCFILYMFFLIHSYSLNLHTTTSGMIAFFHFKLEIKLHAPEKMNAILTSCRKKISC